MGLEAFVVGGAVRDHLLGMEAVDIDLAISADPLPLGRQVGAELGARVIILDAEHLVTRLVWQGVILDLACFKDGTATIVADLRRRDFTVNSMAFTLEHWLAGADPRQLIDPCQGRDDLSKGRLALVYDQALQDDPLRILRGYRLWAQTGFALTADFTKVCAIAKAGLADVAVERVVAELQLIFASPRAGRIMRAMQSLYLFRYIFPELAEGQGVSQPGSHHLDVLDHNIEALACLEKILADIPAYFGDQAEFFHAYLAVDQRQLWLKWAALFHDVGKAATRAERQGRITFYQHDQQGARRFKAIAARLKIGRHPTELISLFIRQHMRPFHLCNVKRQRGTVSVKACLRLARALGEHIPGLFLLAMADSLAGDGEDKPEHMEAEIASLFTQVWGVMAQYITPVLSNPPLLSGHDLIAAGLSPGPRFRQLFALLQELQVTGQINSKAEARAWLRRQVDMENINKI